jgi:hypothetical protein
MITQPRSDAVVLVGATGISRTKGRPPPFTPGPPRPPQGTGDHRIEDWDVDNLRERAHDRIQQS